MSKEKLLNQIIQSLEEPELSKVAIEYLREVHGQTNVFDSNGPYDSTIDIRPDKVSQIECQYASTTNDPYGFEKKLMSDVGGAKKNVEKYKLPNKLTYFYSYPLSTNRVLSLKKQVREKYDIILDIIDANAIAGVCLVYQSIANLLYELNKIPELKEGDEFFEDQKVKAFYDLLSFGKATDIKYQVITCFLLNHLYNKGNLNKTDALADINAHFHSKITEQYFESIIARMSTEHKLHIVSSTNLQLTDAEKMRIRTVLESYKIEEATFLKELNKILTEYDLLKYRKEIIELMNGVYESNYSANIIEFTKRGLAPNETQSKLSTLENFIKSKIAKKEHVYAVTKNLLEVAEKSEILPRIAVGQVFFKASNPEKLQAYIDTNINNKKIYLDSNVVLQLLCVHYENTSEYRNSYYVIARQFWDFIEKQGLNLSIIKPYVGEIAIHFKFALRITQYSKLEVFDLLGGSQNVFYNFYLTLKDYDLLDGEIDSFETFLKKGYGIEIKGDTNYSYEPQITYLMNSMGIEIENIDRNYITTKAQDIITRDLIDKKSNKTLNSIRNDATMMTRLGDPDTDVNAVDPIFCTWDSNLFRSRKLYFDEFPNTTKWFMFSPTRLMDHFSMMQFKVEPGSISNELFYIIEDHHQFRNTTHSLLDTIMTVIDPNNKGGLKYTNMLADLRNKDIVQVDQGSEQISADALEQASAIDSIFQGLFFNYSSKGQMDEKFKDFKLLFTREEYVDDLKSILEKEIAHFNKQGEINKSLFSAIDKLIMKLKTGT